MKARRAESKKSFVFSASLVWLALTLSILCLAQSKQSGAPPLTRSQIRVTEVKPDMLNEGWHFKRTR